MLKARVFQRTWFCAAFGASFQFMICAFNSATVSRLQVFLGCPLFLLPFGILDRACEAGCWLLQDMSNPAALLPSNGYVYRLLSRSLPNFLICDPFMPSDVDDALETGVVKCLDLLESCFDQSSDFTLELRIRCQVVVRMFLEVFSMVNAALALPILDLMSRTVPPCLSITLHSQMKDSTSFTNCVSGQWC